MKKGQKIFYVDIAGNVYTYIVTEVNEKGVQVAWEEDTSIFEVFVLDYAEALAKKYPTFEDAQREADKRKSI